MEKPTGAAIRLVLPILAMIFYSTICRAQLTDLARLEYSFIPKNDSEDDYMRLRGLVNFPIEVSDDSYVVIGAEYNRIILDLEDEYPFDKELLRALNVIDFSLGYTFKMNQRWRFGAKIMPRIASTLNSGLGSDDLFFNGGVYFINDRQGENVSKPYRLILGLTYNSTSGLPFPLLLINYHREVNDTWAFSLGVPKTNIKYSFNEKNILQAFLTVDGYYANIQKELVINEDVANSISMSVLVGGLGYEHCFTKHLVTFVYTGYTISLQNNLRNRDRDEIYSLDDIRTFYLRTGIKFKI